MGSSQHRGIPGGIVLSCGSASDSGTGFEEAMMKCVYGEHKWEWVNEDGVAAWTCELYGDLSFSSAFIEPCLNCGASVEAEEVYCADCLSEVA